MCDEKLPKKKRYVLSDGRIVYCYVNPIFNDSKNKSKIELLIEYLILTNGAIIKKDKKRYSSYSLELDIDMIDIWIGNYPYSYGHLHYIDYGKVKNPFGLTSKEQVRELQPSNEHKNRLNELLKALKKLGELPENVSTDGK